MERFTGYGPEEIVGVVGNVIERTTGSVSYPDGCDIASDFVRDFQPKDNNVQYVRVGKNCI